MSDEILSIIPMKPHFLPTEKAQNEAREKLELFLLHFDEIEIEVTENIRFIDQGENFESVNCPFCNKELDMDWWNTAMNKAYETDFENLEIIVPCCQKSTSLNDLSYHSTAGFARFALKVLNPPHPDLNESQLFEIEQILGCSLKKVEAHI